MFLDYDEMKAAAEEIKDAGSQARAFWMLSNVIRFNGFATKDELAVIERLIDEGLVSEF